MESAHLADVAILINVNIDGSWTLFILNLLLLVWQKFGDQLQVWLVQDFGCTVVSKGGALRVRISKGREWFQDLDLFRKAYLLSWTSAILSLTAVMVWETGAFFAGWLGPSEWVAMPLSVWFMWTGGIYALRGARLTVSRIRRVFA